MIVTRTYFSLACSRRLARNFRTVYQLSDALELLLAAGLAEYRAAHLYQRADVVHHQIDEVALFAATGGRFPVLFVRCSFPRPGFPTALLDPVIAQFQLTLLHEVEE